MALNADEKEKIMQSREKERLTSKTHLYTATVDGKNVCMLSVSGLDADSAEKYCYGIFGDRMTDFR